jgi:hypothetical protein
LKLAAFARLFLNHHVPALRVRKIVISRDGGVETCVEGAIVLVNGDRRSNSSYWTPIDLPGTFSSDHKVSRKYWRTWLGPGPTRLLVPGPGRWPPGVFLFTIPNSTILYSTIV